MRESGALFWDRVMSCSHENLSRDYSVTVPCGQESLGCPGGEETHCLACGAFIIDDPCGEATGVSGWSYKQRKKPIRCAESKWLDRSFFEERIMKDPNSGCWLWIGAMHTKNGYGELRNPKGGYRLAHRHSWEMFFGPIPDGLYVLHKCDTPLCVRPDHLFLGTYADNAADKASKGRSVRGEDSIHAKLTKEQVYEIRASKQDSETLSLRYGVSRRTINSVKNRETWGHL